MKIILLSIVLMLSLESYSQTKITFEDLKVVIGNWEGSLTYIDYQTGKPYTMPANLTVKKGKNENELILRNFYPKEPKANNSDKIKLSKNGLLINKHAIVARKELDDGDVLIQTEHRSKDKGRKALIRYSYIIGTHTFIIRKEVKFENSKDWLKRNEYNYIKNL